MEEFKTFASSLSPNYWGTNFRHTHGQFDDYIDKFSDLMKRCNSLFQFISVGACDGTSDPAIASFYDRKHWNAVFVEASPPNIGFLKEKIIEKEVSGRSIVMHVAAMEVCKSPTVEFARPIVENEKAQHWLRRQVGRVPDKENAIEFFKKNPKKWAVDTVRCLTGSHIVSEWERTSPLSTKTPGIR